ncbi:hypothetical protein [Larkinella humicola]|uniref:Uncharacterized protein n=1 Tax=Larkinella humicola TaxID=2607654 RepID=A0A5N1J353_9BACT|nr:hypothetical protein [Larkinella humicola]KAA9341168.1 hypothetical protein F0P93_30500 [Larkinella humicola]
MILTTELLAIECVNALFWNYTNTDIHVLRVQYKDFDYIWDTYISDLSGQDSFNMLWECWMTKMNVETKAGIIEYALEKYGDEKRGALVGATRAADFWKSLDDGD